MNEFGFAFEEHDAVVPMIDGTLLTEWVDIFETIEDMEPAGEMYGGLSRDDRGAKPFQPGKKPQLVLGCSCGHADCWPLYARITEDKHTVVWDEFSQPRRKGRDYSAFGPFRFDRAQYGKVLLELG
ncbi:hypothetical protein [Lentzea sp. NPDC092896]|uniref:hypothetical protein n=1 Tax=Lentzea sp. NPDC092896 TaxID=3364127 RepID=UPI0038177915